METAGMLTHARRAAQLIAGLTLRIPEAGRTAGPRCRRRLREKGVKFRRCRAGPNLTIASECPAYFASASLLNASTTAFASDAEFSISMRSVLSGICAAGPASTWNERELLWAFSMTPAFYQTGTFYLSCGLGLLVIAAGWQLRMRKMRQELAAVLKERVRLSREIHDTLLQSLLGVALQLEAASRGALTPRARDTLGRDATPDRRLHS